MLSAKTLITDKFGLCSAVLAGITRPIRLLPHAVLHPSFSSSNTRVTCHRCIHASASAATLPTQQRHRRRNVAAAASKPAMVLESQPMLSDLLTESTGPLETIAWKALLDIALPILCLWCLLKIVDWAADQARVDIDARFAGDSSVVDELQKKSTLFSLVLLAMRTPAKFMLPPWLLAYTLRTALNIVDLVVNKYKPKLPQLVDYVVKEVSAQLVPFDAALQTLLTISGVMFLTWFLVRLKNILIREVILVRAIRSGNKELERVYLPLSSLITWAAVLGCGLSICSSLGVNLKPLLAVGGAGGIAAGFASQQLLLNVVAGVNIFLTRPFIAGDQVVFEGGANIEGTVEGVEITRTMLRTADGTLVALPNKLISDLIVYNRTRTLEAAPQPSAAVAAAPLRRVLCFTLQLDRSFEPQLDDIRGDVMALLNQITKDQLIQSGLTPEPEEEGSEDATSSSSSHDGSDVSSKVVRQETTQGQVAAAAAAAVAATAGLAAAAATGRAAKQQGSQRDTTTSADQDAPSGSAATVSREEGSGSPEPEPLLVSITLKQLTESKISLFVRCEMLLPGSSMMDAVERQTESTLIAISGLVKEKYDAVLLW